MTSIYLYDSFSIWKRNRSVILKIDSLTGRYENNLHLLDTSTSLQLLFRVFSSISDNTDLYITMNDTNYYKHST